MVNIPISNFNWCLLIINDPKYVPGESIFNVINLIIKKIDVKFVILSDINGSNISSLVDLEDGIVEIEIFMGLVSKVNQFEWGDFFLFKEYPEHWNPSSDNFYPDAISQTVTTIRAIDNQYIYVYTPYEQIAELIMENYELESIKISSLKHSDYPY